MPAPLRILCFGDSLTAGWSRGGRVYRPYALALAERLRAAGVADEVEVEDDGVPGALATGERFAERFRQRMETDTPWDWVIVLGGTNDFAYGLSPERLFTALSALWGMTNANVLALTVPETYATSASLERKRNDLNARILSHSAPRYHAFDLASALPYHSLSHFDREEFWDDGVHLTPVGYDRMGTLVGDALVELIRNAPSTNAS